MTPTPSPRQPPVVEYLQEDVERVRSGLSNKHLPCPFTLTPKFR